MTQNKYPLGWDEQKVRKVFTHYEEQSEDAAVAEDDAGIESSDTVMSVPLDLVSKVRELIAKRQS